MNLRVWITSKLLYLCGIRCGEYFNSYHNNDISKPCILAPGHTTCCMTDWFWKQNLNCYVRYQFTWHNGTINSRAELYDNKADI